MGILHRNREKREIGKVIVRRGRGRERSREARERGERKRRHAEGRKAGAGEGRGERGEIRERQRLSSRSLSAREGVSGAAAVDSARPEHRGVPHRN